MTADHTASTSEPLTEKQRVPVLTEAQRQIIARDLERSGFLGWLLSSGDSALWAKRTPEEETARVLAPVIARLIADATDALHAELEAAEAKVAAARNLVSDWQANSGSRALGDPTAETWLVCADQLFTALGGEQS